MISRDDWLSALTDVGLHHESDDLAVTTNEFAVMFGICRSTANSQLAKLVASGKATLTRKTQQNAHGRTLSYVAYRLAKPAAPERRRVRR